MARSTSTSTTPSTTPAKRTRVPQLTAPQLKASMAKNLAGFTAYETARLARAKDGVTAAQAKKLTATMEANRPAFTVYWRGFNDPRNVAARAAARAAKAATS